MKLLIAIYFFILAVIQIGLFSGVYNYYRGQKLVRPSSYWMTSLFASFLGLLIFGFGVLTLDDIRNPEFNFTVANSLFYSAAVLQALFCKSINQKISPRLNIVFAVTLLSFILLFEYMRLNSTFEMRNIFMASLAIALYTWQIIVLNKKKKETSSRQLQYLQYATSAEMVFALGRITILTVTKIPILEIDQLPQTLILFTIAQLVMNTLSYITIGGYWTEQIAVANSKSHFENQEIRVLLEERENLINSLLQANKTAATGALSASIAHELNQPLGASALNIQFMQKKLANGKLTPEIQGEILAALLDDNQRAANIIRNLRSLFADDPAEINTVNLAELIDAVLQLTRSEIELKRINIEKILDPNLILRTSHVEIQQVLLNLINNSLQALEKSSQIHKKIVISGRHTDHSIVISIADNGDGAPQTVRAHLFELLTKSQNKGMGLGLWLCKHIVTRHGGSIRHEPNEGGGAKFIVELPAA